MAKKHKTTELTTMEQVREDVLNGGRQRSKKSYKPTERERRIVTSMTAYGVPPREIATCLGIAEVMVIHHFKEELNTGATVANAIVAEALFKNAVQYMNVSAQQFWLKCRAGWSEMTKDQLAASTAKVEHISKGMTIEQMAEAYHAKIK